MIERTFALVILHTEDERVLLQLRDDIPTISHPNHWGLFGGRIESSESPLAAATREIVEELSIELIERGVIRQGEFRYEPGKVHHLFSYAFRDELSTAQLNEGQRFESFARNDMHGGNVGELSVIPSHYRMLEAFWQSGSSTAYQR